MTFTIIPQKKTDPDTKICSLKKNNKNRSRNKIHSEKDAHPQSSHPNINIYRTLFNFNLSKKHFFHPTRSYFQGKRGSKTDRKINGREKWNKKKRRSMN